MGSKIVSFRARLGEDPTDAAAAMRREHVFQSFNFLVNILLISSVLLTLFGLAWEYSTRWYLQGFSNAVLPYSSSPEEKVAAILAWMERGPARQTEYYSDNNENRDPVDTLNYKELLNVCGTATNAFVNLASAGGLQARRLLLLDQQGLSTNHVVAEVLIDGRWVIVDPSFHAILTDSSGRLLTRKDLADPAVLQDATQKLRGYDPEYNYKHTAFVHLGHLPFVGGFLQKQFDTALASWQERINWTLLLERQSYGILVVGIGLLCFAIALRRATCWYGRKCSITPASPWEQLRHNGVLLFSAVPSGEKERRQVAVAERPQAPGLLKSNI